MDRECFEGKVKLATEIMSDVVVLSHIGTGGFGEVKKIMYKDLFVACMKTGKEDNPQMVSLFLQEARVLYKLAGVGGAPKLHAVAKNHPVIIMEFCEGVTLEKLSELECGQGMSLGKFFGICNQDEMDIRRAVLKSVGCRLMELHQAGYCHNDFYTRNVIVNKNGDAFEARIVDFGHAGPKTPLDIHDDLADFNTILREFGLLPKQDRNPRHPKKKLKGLQEMVETFLK